MLFDFVSCPRYSSRYCTPVSLIFLSVPPTASLFAPTILHESCHLANGRLLLPPSASQINQQCFSSYFFPRLFPFPASPLFYLFYKSLLGTFSPFPQSLHSLHAALGFFPLTTSCPSPAHKLVEGTATFPPLPALKI